MAQGSNPGKGFQPDVDDMRRMVQAWYPDLHIQTYCVPPCIMNRVPYYRTYVEGQPVLTVTIEKRQTPKRQRSSEVPEKPLGYSMWTRERKPRATPEKVDDAHIRDDFAQQHILYCLKKLGQMQLETMFVISQLDYSDYLNKQAYSAAVAKLPRPAVLPPPDRKGDFDLLVIHRYYGILVGEVKAVGHNQAVLDNVIKDRIKKAVDQLEKSARVVKHIVSDLASDLAVRKTLILPYVTTTQLQQVLDADRQLGQAVCDCVGAPDTVQAVQLCLCADQLSHRDTPWHVPRDVLLRLHDWFERRMSCTVDPNMLDAVYLDLVARMVGPATTVAVWCPYPPRLEVRTLGEAVSEIGDRLAWLVLRPEQLELLERAPDKVCLVGPPGTGKTVLLVMIALKWLQQGHDVHVLVLFGYMHAVSCLIKHQLEMTLGEDPKTAGKVRFHLFDLSKDSEFEMERERAVQTLMAASSGQDLHIIMDEVHRIKVEGYRWQEIFKQLETDLSASNCRLHMWMAYMYDFDIPPDMQTEFLTVPLRSAPVVVREIEPGIVQGIPFYTSSGAPLPSDGPEIIRLRHEGSSHTGRDGPPYCFECGVEVAEVLTRLGVGDQGSSGTIDSSTSASTTSVPRLQYRDVFVLTSTAMMSETSGFVRGLHSSGIPVRVIDSMETLPNHEQNMIDLATAVDNKVTVPISTDVAGLERKVVVLLKAHNREEVFESKDRLDYISRCSTQLVIVEMSHDDGGDHHLDSLTEDMTATLTMHIKHGGVEEEWTMLV